MQQACDTPDSAPVFLREDWRPWAFIVLLSTLLFAVRLLTPSNLLDQDQEVPATYVLDIIQNGNWVCQHDLAGNVASKPPFYSWLVALVSLPFGRINLFSLYLPGALALLGEGCLVFGFGRAFFGGRAGVFGAMA